MLTGTDAPVPGLAPGFALHDEFESLSRCGMSNLQISKAPRACLPSGWESCPIAEPWKQASAPNLVLLDANPLENISNTRRIAAVIANGHYLPRVELDRGWSASLSATGSRRPVKRNRPCVAH